MNNKLLIIVIAFFLFSSCSKNNGSNGEKIFRIYGGGQLQGEFVYNNEGLLSGHVTYFAGKKGGEVICHYNAGKQLIKRETAVDLSSSTTNPQWSYSYTEYVYTADGKISEEKNYLKQNTAYVLVSKTKPGYDASGRLLSRTILSPADVPIQLSKYQYGSDGNIILQENFRYNGAVTELHFKYSYDDYDNKTNPYLNLASEVPPFSVNRNNILQTTVTNYIVTPGTPVVTISRSVYSSYNRNGLPTKVSENGTEFIYEYK